MNMRPKIYQMQIQISTFSFLIYSCMLKANGIQSVYSSGIQISNDLEKLKLLKLLNFETKIFMLNQKF
jgi:hypothetical protein